MAENPNNASPLKKQPMGRTVVLIALAILAIILGIGWYLCSTQKPAPQPAVETKTSVPQQSVAAAPPPRQETASAGNACCCPCPHKEKPAHLAKKKVRRPKPAPVVVAVAPATPVPSEPKGCVEIHFTTKPGDTVVKSVIIGPAGPSVAKDSCTGIKRPEDSTFGPWLNEFCPNEPAILCDFSEHERIMLKRISGQKILLVGGYRIKVQGEHVLRLPGFVAEKGPGYETVLFLARGNPEQPAYPTEEPGDTKAFLAAYKYGEERQEWIGNNSDGVGVRRFDFDRNGVARIYYDKSEVPQDAAQLYWTWGKWRGP